ncbi:hypothetical protein F7734_54090 [Scytonema sp. UIC 10036]|uniref:DUF1772 domain-containing protein n=1 Tax=Scytonema sp. UIC 10036 TaxID=2304196 RepID=UPI0012DA22D3|nr:DUF1772 domain-containing protein [Scytonema sp. UIC 10036]MUH00734.1 hypothetical protein [Scytonema sp. UIC 10036]
MKYAVASRDRVLRYLLVISILGFTHWFFGNLYEQIVLAPNLLGLGVEGLQLWRQFFQFSDPRYYFLPLNPIAILVTFAALAISWRSHSKQRKWLMGAASFALVTGLLTVYIVTQINLKLYFGPLSDDISWLQSTQQLSATLGKLRLVSELITLYCALRAYLLMLRDRNNIAYKKTTDPMY